MIRWVVIKRRGEVNRKLAKKSTEVTRKKILLSREVTTGRTREVCKYIER